MSRVGKRIDINRLPGGLLAQPVERFVYTEDVGGSNPSQPTNILKENGFIAPVSTGVPLGCPGNRRGEGASACRRSCPEGDRDTRQGTRPQRHSGLLFALAQRSYLQGKPVQMPPERAVDRLPSGPAKAGAAVTPEAPARAVHFR